MLLIIPSCLTLRYTFWTFVKDFKWRILCEIPSILLEYCTCILGGYRECDDTVAGAVLEAFCGAYVDALALVRSGSRGVAIGGTLAICCQETHFANGLVQEEAGIVRSADERLRRQVPHELRVALFVHH